jgi:Zn finger protein HypA/HybF involved in hydrogenase expression
MYCDKCNDHITDNSGRVLCEKCNAQPIKMATVTVKDENGAILAVLHTGMPVLIRERNGVTVDIC